jgi:hypothetical protein
MQIKNKYSFSVASWCGAAVGTLIFPAMLASIIAAHHQRGGGRALGGEAA